MRLAIVFAGIIPNYSVVNSLLFFDNFVKFLIYALDFVGNFCRVLDKKWQFGRKGAIFFWSSGAF